MFKILVRNIICVAGLIVVLPFFLVYSFLLLLEDGRPLLFSQQMLGKNKRCFDIYKLRTMKNDTPNKGTHEIQQDSYLTIGRFARKIKLDEFPQLINVLKGDLNLIGHRPGLSNQVALRDNRDSLSVFDHKPGITVLSQVTGHDMSDPKLLSKIDAIYPKIKSIKLDIKILFATITGIFRNNLLEIVKRELKDV